MLYAQDKTLENLGNAIIAANRPGLVDAKICYMFREKASITRDKVIAGRCIRVDDRNYSIHKYDFLIEIAMDLWQEANDDFKKALMDHELGHAGIVRDENGELELDDKGRIRTYVNLHDIEEFSDVLARHGAYHEALRQFLQAFADRKSKTKKAPEAEEDLDLE